MVRRPMSIFVFLHHYTEFVPSSIVFELHMSISCVSIAELANAVSLSSTFCLLFCSVWYFD